MFWGYDDMIVWEKRFSVGVPELDDQRRRLVELVEELSDGVHGGLDEFSVSVLLDALLKNAGFHFANEEAALEDAGYEGLVQQRISHGVFLDMVGKLKEKNNRGRQVTESALLSMAEWLDKHLGGEDLKYAGFLLGKQITYPEVTPAPPLEDDDEMIG